MNKTFWFILLLFPLACFAADGPLGVEHPAKVIAVATPDTILGVSGLAGTAGGCTTIADQESGTPDGDTNLFTGSTTLYVGSQFYADSGGAGYDLCKVVVRLKRNNDTAQSISFHAEIWTNDGGSPPLPSSQTGSDSEETYTRTSDLTTSYQDISFTWASPISLSPDTYYWIVLVADAGSSSNYVQMEKTGSGSGCGANEEIAKADATPTFSNYSSFNTNTMTIYE